MTFIAVMQGVILVMLIGSTWFVVRTNRNLIETSHHQNETIRLQSMRIDAAEHRLRVLELRNTL